jgi:hypothetical protein
MIVWAQGLTPGKQLLKMRVTDRTSGKPVKWGHMAIREFLLPLAFSTAMLPIVLVMSLIPITEVAVAAAVLWYVGSFAGQLVDAFWIFKGGRVNRLVDVFAKTDVLNESTRQA